MAVHANFILFFEMLCMQMKPRASAANHER